MIKYCNKKCQKSHFPSHKIVCRFAYEIMSDPLDSECNLPLFINHARQNQDFFVYERVIEIFENSTWTVEDVGDQAWFAIAESYLNIGQDEKAAHALKKCEETDILNLGQGERFVISLGLKLNKITRFRKNPPPKAFETLEAFRGILLESSQDLHLKLAASSPVMDTIQNYIKWSYVEELQDECVSDMMYSLKEKSGHHMALWCIGSNTDLLEILQEKVTKSGICESIWRAGVHFFPRHPEFPQVYEKYRTLYESLYLK